MSFTVLHSSVEASSPYQEDVASQKPADRQSRALSVYQQCKTVNTAPYLVLDQFHRVLVPGGLYNALPKSPIAVTQRHRRPQTSLESLARDLQGGLA
jgi:hypothetical protein